MKNKIKQVMETSAPPINKIGFYKKNKLRVVIIYEDNSYEEFYKGFGDGYTITIDKRDYIIDPDCIHKGKFPMLQYYFNNPFPIKPDYKSAKKGTKDINKENWQNVTDNLVEVDVTYDAKLLNNILNTSVISKLYEEKSDFTIAQWFYVIGGILVAVLIVLQLTGTVDVIGSISGTAKKIGGV